MARCPGSYTASMAARRSGGRSRLPTTSALAGVRGRLGVDSGSKDTLRSMARADGPGKATPWAELSGWVPSVPGVQEANLAGGAVDPDQRAIRDQVGGVGHADGGRNAV